MKSDWRLLIFFIVFLINAKVGADPVLTDQLLIENITIRGVVFDVLQDSRGFLWLGTEFGLVRYDGHEYEYFEHEPGNPNSLAGNAVKRIVETPDGILWIGTMNSGIHRFDPKTRKFKRFLHNPEDASTIANNRINDLCLDNSGNLWIGTDGNGVDRLDLHTEKVYHYHQKDGKGIGAHGFSIFDIHFTRNGQLWVGGYKSLDLYNPEKDNFTHFQEAYLQDTINHVISAIGEDENSLLIGTKGGELFRFDVEYKKFEPWPLPVNSDTNGGGRSIWAIHQDTEGRTWMGRSNQLILLTSPTTQNNLTALEYHVVYQEPMYRVFGISQSSDGIIWAGNEQGLQQISLRPKKLQHHIIEIIRNKQTLHPGAAAFASLDTDHIWVGSTQGLFLFNRKNNTLSEELLQVTGLQKLIGKNIRTLYHDTHDNLWITTVVGYNLGFEVFCLNLKTMQLKDFTRRIRPFYFNVTLSITEDANGNIWFANGAGLVHYAFDTDRFTVYKNDPKDPFSIPDDAVRKIFRDTKDRLWIGFNRGGVVRFDPTSKHFIKVYKNKDSNPPESFGRVRDITEDHQGNIWIGTNGGLHCLHPDSLTTITYTKQQGLPDNTPSSILVDNNDHVWIGTLNGFAKLNPALRSINSFSYKEGMQDTDYWNRSSFLAPDGFMYFGGSGGFNYFHPDSLSENATYPKVYITGFSLFNTAVQPNDSSSLLKEGISYTSEIHLKYNQNVFSFRYAALNYLFPEKTQFAYRMEGFDEEWQYVGSKREVTYTNLDPGSYTFQVRASNENGDWQEESASLNLLIAGPWWKSWWAYSLYSLLVVGFITGIRYYEIKQIKLRQKSAHLIELDTLKTRFFANISHEFRTPLTLILGPAQHILEESFEESVRQNAKIILRNSNHLLNLVNQLLDISKLEAGKMGLQARKIDLVELFKHIASSYDSLIADKRIKYEYKSATPHLKMYLDQEKIEKIVHNLLSNAFKFTPDGGHVTVQLKIKDKKWVLICVTDTGPGIPHNQLDKVFDRFYMIDNSNTRTYEGSGLGMALAKELVELHGGSISVESEKGMGATFTVKLPLDKSYLSPDEIVTIPTVSKTQPLGKKQLISESDIVSDTRPGSEYKIENSEETPVLLIVEDNVDMRHYIGMTLEKYYQIVEANNGKEGLQKAREILPDLIISDVMMPEMDGLHLCELIKSQELTSHIPVVLLTAKADRQSKLSGLQLGADDYLSKPFDTDELLLIVRNRIEERRKIQERVSQEANFGIQRNSLTSLDEKFLKKVFSIIEKNLDNDKFTIEILSQEAGFSRVQLYRKIKALTNQPPNYFLRVIRLNRAAEMLRAKSDTISQIAYSVGFNSLSYFNKCFKEEFGVTPTEYEEANWQAK